MSDAKTKDVTSPDQSVVTSPSELQKGIGDVLTHIVRSSREKLLNTPESDLVSDYWGFKFDESKSTEWNIYRFSERLESYKRDMRRWEEHHNGSCCVVERVRDKYLMPQIQVFANKIKSM